jgi:hypothetical protein
MQACAPVVPSGCELLLVQSCTATAFLQLAINKFYTGVFSVDGWSCSFRFVVSLKFLLQTITLHLNFGTCYPKFWPRVHSG